MPIDLDKIKNIVLEGTIWKDEDDTTLYAGVKVDGEETNLASLFLTNKLDRSKKYKFTVEEIPK